jgi:LysM repeat protein
MAAKKGKTTRKYKQAKQAAKPAAKAAFSGKKQASRKDPKIKISAEDKMALKDMKDTAKADLGKNAYLSRAEYEANQAKAREAFRSAMRTEFGEYGGKKASPAEAAMKDTKAGGRTTPKPKTAKKAAVKKAAPTKLDKNFGKYGALDEYQIEKNLEKEEKAAKKSAPKKKAAVKKPAVKKAAASKPSAPATSKSATAAEPKQKPAVKKPAPKKKAATKKVSSPKVTRPTDASLTAMEDEKIKKTTEKLIKEGKLSGSKELAIRPKGTVASTRTGTVATTTSPVRPIPGSDTVVKKNSKLKKLGKFGVVTAALAAALDVKNMTEGQKRLAQAEAELFYAKKGRNRNVGERIADVATKSLPASAKQLGKYFTMGLVGEDVGVAATKAEKKLAQYKQKKTAAANKGLRYGPMGESLVPGTDAYKKGSKIAPKFKDGKVIPGAMPGAKPGTAGGATGGKSGGATGGKSGATPGAGGSTIKATPGSTYIVKSGDTLSAIAKASGVSLSEIRKANKKFATNPKYKQGNMIWSGTKVNIPKK